MTHRRADPAPVSGDYLDWRAERQISEEEIFAALIKTEVRAGRLTAARRRRLVRYAAHLRLSAVDVGRMIAACRPRSQQDTPCGGARPMLKLTPALPPRGGRLRIAGLVALALTVDALILWWVF